MKNVYIIMAIFIFMLSLGCETTTTDPRQGGLFSYNPKAYEKRLEDRRNQRTVLEKQNAQMQKGTEILKGESAGKQAELDEMAAKVASLDEEVNKIEKEIANATLSTDAQKHAKWKLDLKLNGLKSKLTDTTDLKEKELKKLQKDLDNLLEEAMALSNL